MNKIYRGWYLSSTGDLDECGSKVYKAVKGKEVIYGTLNNIKLEIDQRVLKEMREAEESTDGN